MFLLKLFLGGETADAEDGGKSERVDECYPEEHQIETG